MDNNNVGLLEDESQPIGEVARKENEKVAVDTSADPLASATPSNKSGSYEKEQVDWEKRYGDMRRYHDKIVNDNKKEIEELRAQVESGRHWSVPETKEELEALKEKDPELYEAIQTGTKVFADSQINEVRKENIKLKKEAELAKLKFMHPDFEEIKGSEQFKSWLGKQPQEIKDWLYKKVDATLAGKALDMYKKDTTPASDDSKGKKVDTSAADEVKTKQSVDTETKDEHIYTREEINKMTPSYFEKVKDVIEAQWRRGLIK